MHSKIGKTFVFSGLALSAGLMALPHSAQGATIAGFTFETLTAGTTGTTGGPLTADVGTGTAFGVHAGATAVYSAPAGNGSVHAFSSNVWAANDYYEFRVPTTGFDTLTVSYDETRSGTGPDQMQLQYSTNAGGSFTTFGSSYTLAGSTWQTSAAATAAGNSFSFDLSAVTALNNNANVYFRVVSTGLNSSGGTSLATAGSNRIDNFFVTGSAVPEPATMALVTIAGAAAMVRRRRPE